MFGLLVLSSRNIGRFFRTLSKQLRDVEIGKHFLQYTRNFVNPYKFIIVFHVRVNTKPRVGNLYLSLI